MELKILRKEEIGILHRQWMWADYIKQLYESSLKSTSNEVLISPLRFYAYPVGCYMSLWYALLFSVLEQFRTKKIKIKIVEPEIGELYDSLEKLRHAVFHAPYKYWDMRWFNPLKVKGAGNKIRKIHNTIGEVFLDVMK